MRRRLLFPPAFAQASSKPVSGPLTITAVNAWRLREPDSGRRYTVVRVTAQNGAQGYGEGGAIKSADFAEARSVVLGRRATELEWVRHQRTTPNIGPRA